MQLRSIEVDIDIHKKIEANRKSFDETPNDVLRRLLGFQEQKIQSATGSKIAEKNWRRGSVVLPSGTKLKMEYNNVIHLSEIVDGKWIDENGKQHHSPSGAMIALARTKDGRRTNLNGKQYWRVNKPGEEKWTLYWLLEYQADKKKKDAV